MSVEVASVSEEDEEGSEVSEDDLDETTTEEILDANEVKTKEINLEEQINSYKETIAKAVKGKKKEVEVEAMNELGNIFYNVGRYNEAKSCHERQLQLAILLKDSRIERRALCNLGCTTKHLKDYDTALDCFQKGLEKARDEKDQKSEGKFLNNLASAYEAMADFENALKYYELRSNLAKQTKDVIAETKCCASIGNVHHVSGNIRESIRYFERVVVCIKLRIASKNRKEEKNDSVVLSNKENVVPSEDRESTVMDGQSSTRSNKPQL